MSKWTHSICTECWEKKYPGRGAHRLLKADTEKCCFCGKEHASGIFVREHPADMECNGVHGNAVMEEQR
jgi:hypothetical protein